MTNGTENQTKPNRTRPDQNKPNDMQAEKQTIVF